MNGLVCDLGRMRFGEALSLQHLIHQMVSAEGEETLLLVEHEPVLTLGASFHAENLLYSPGFYKDKGIELEKTDRGGDVTYHGPGQLTIYPIFDLARREKDVHKWLRDLEETQIRVLESIGLRGTRFPPHTGVWCNGLKVAAIGVKLRKWISLHGVALNCDLELDPFRWIIPCGIHDHGVSSLSELTDKHYSVEAAKPLVIAAFEDVFGLSLTRVSFDQMLP